MYIYHLFIFLKISVDELLQGYLFVSSRNVDL